MPIEYGESIVTPPSPWEICAGCGKPINRFPHDYERLPKPLQVALAGGQRRARLVVRPHPTRKGVVEQYYDLDCEW